MTQQRSSAPLSSWLSPLIPGSWVQGKALHLKKAEAVSLVGYGTVMSMFCNTAGEASSLKQLLLFWGCAEAAFYVYQKWRYTIVNREWVDEVDVDRVQEVKKRFLRLHGVLSIQDFICGWFHGAPYDQIHRGNVLDFVAYGFYSKQPRDLSPKTQASSEHFVDEVERRWGVKFPEGRNPNLNFMAHLWEPLRVFHKPLLVHVLSESWGMGMHLYLRAIGFKHAFMGGMSYWVRLPTSGPLGSASDSHAVHEVVEESAKQQLSLTRPIVFLHGVGLGLTPYIHFMRMLFAATSSHPMIVLEFRHVSMRLCLRAGEVDHAAHAVAAIVQKLGFKEACVVGHSFGTFVASRLCQLHPSLVQSLMIIDPVCMLTCCPKLLHSFVYKVPELGVQLLTPLGLMDIARFVCSRDLIIAETFCRKFCWHSLMLWPEDMPQATTVSLSANDDLVPRDLVVAQLEASPLPAKVMVHPTAGHGGYLLDQQYQESLIVEVQRMATIP
ncbi:hypothetical protein ABBQ38_014780 [Trebouxia sp. C0009 RCD-2024]